MNDDRVQALLEARDGTLWIGSVTALHARILCRDGGAP